MEIKKMFKKKNLRVVALVTVMVLCLGLMASCAGNNNDGLNGVTGSVGGNLSAGNKQESAGNDAQNNADNNQGNGDEQQPGTDTPAGDTPSGDTPTGNDTPVGNEGGEEDENDPYAAMKADKTGTPLKILCQNLRYNAKSEKGGTNDAEIRRYRFQELMKKYDPDVVGMQECDEFWINALQQDYGKEYTLFYHYRDSVSYGSSDEATPVMWKTAKYDMVKSGYFWLSKTPNQTGPSYEQSQLPRIVNWVTLKDKETGVEFNVYSTHFAFYSDDKSVEGIHQQISNAFAGHPKNTYSFVMGDFNFPYRERQWLILVDEVNIVDLRDVATAMNENDHCTLGDIRKGAYNAFTEDDGSVFGDFIMAAPRKHLAIDFFGYCYEKPGVPDRGIEEGFVSDHFAVYTEVRMDTDISYAEYYADSAT